MRLRLRLRSFLIAVPFLGLGSYFLPALDAAAHGPYSIWFNSRCRDICVKAKLVGRPVKDVISILGPPTYYNGLDPSERTYNYCPVPFAPGSKFQVHCDHGIVTSIELMDD